MSTILFISGQTMGDALAGSGRTLQGAFQSFGFDFMEINLMKPDAVSILNGAIASGGIEFVFTHAGMAADWMGRGPSGDEVNLWQSIGVPYISFYGDSPAYFFDRHVMPGPGFASFYAFPEHLAFRRRLPKQNGLMGLTPLMPMDEISSNEVDFPRKVGGRLLFLKNGNDPERLVRSWEATLPVDTFLMLADIAGELASRLDKDAEVDLDDTVCKYFSHRGLEIEASVNLRLLFVAQLDDYLRRLKSTLMATVLRDFPVDVYGSNWEHVDFAGARARHFPVADFRDSRQSIVNSLALLDMSPNTSRGPHDRALRAFGLHTLCLTNEQQYFAETFADHKSFTFRFSRESLANTVSDVLANPKRSVDLGIANSEQFRQSHGSEQFVRTILDAASLLRTLIGGRRQGMQDYFAWPAAKLT